jgi:hypothetical protein
MSSDPVCHVVPAAVENLAVGENQCRAAVDKESLQTWGENCSRGALTSGQYVMGESIPACTAALWLGGSPAV